MTAQTTLTKRQPAWHKEAASTLKQNFATIHAAFLDATNKAVWLGFFLISIKARGKEDGSIPHGQFRAWVTANIPEISYDTVSSYMLIGRNVAEKAKLQITDFPFFARGGNLTSLELLSQPAASLPPGLRQIRERIDKMIHGKSQTQLLLDFKQVETGDDGELHVKRGRLKGQGGATKLQRENAQQRDEAARIEQMEIRAAEVADWLLDVSENNGLPMIADDLRRRLSEAIATATPFLRV